MTDISNPHNPATPDVRLLVPGKTVGMFAVVHRVALAAKLAEEGGYQFIVRWRKGAYSDPTFPQNPWTYYFHPVFPDAKLPNSGVPNRDVPGEPINKKDNPFAPRMFEGQRDSMMLPTDRHLAKSYLDRFIKLNTPTQTFIDMMSQMLLTRPTIGLHIRGAGRLHGGAQMLRQMASDGDIPYKRYFDAVEAQLDKRPDAQVFACSDSQTVIDAVAEYFGDKATFYPATRSAFGEMHCDHPENKGADFPKYKLGLDVLVEAHLLARCIHLVHGNSNVTNHVLCLAPDLSNTYVYEDLEGALYKHVEKEVLSSR